MLKIEIESENVAKNAEIWIRSVKNQNFEKKNCPCFKKSLKLHNKIRQNDQIYKCTYNFRNGT